MSVQKVRKAVIVVVELIKLLNVFAMERDENLYNLKDII